MSDTDYLSETAEDAVRILREKAEKAGITGVNYYRGHLETPFGWFRRVEREILKGRDKKPQSVGGAFCIMALATAVCAWLLVLKGWAIWKILMWTAPQIADHLSVMTCTGIVAVVVLTRPAPNSKPHSAKDAFLTIMSSLFRESVSVLIVVLIVYLMRLMLF
jgi:hypothetical protein